MSGVKIGMNAGGIKRPGAKPHRSVVEGKVRSEAFYLKRSNNLKRIYNELVSDFKHYNVNERPVIKKLDINDQTYMNSAAGPTIIDTLQGIARNKANIAQMHKLLGF
jgi:hypothetical protein